MSKKEQIHIVYTKEGNWATKKPNGKRASTLSNTKNEAIRKARAQAKNHGNTEVKIHRKDGKITESNTYTRKKDPRCIGG